ncbi:aspartate dehydrogenase [Chelativorans intermedius]|uniref:L-aspartate dehydrogenase n=1 Tax=Chelativorans intermedius TaxID=515947 RepID=A0ABV6D4E5_9HYPH|nr:aspartate dehydrogenase [Chelativorans intermedius]MCT8997588.1 aspartate dehydrogenase [Chelativorans intermedius]
MHLGLIGFGNIATTLLELLPEALGRPLERLSVVSMPADAEPVRSRLARDFSAVARAFSVVCSSDQMEGRPDLVVECAGHGAVSSHVPGLLRAGIDVVVVSVGALAEPRIEAELKEAARAGNARLILPAGAIGGVDLLSALKVAGDVKVSYRGIKPPAAWAGTPAERAVDLERIRTAHVFFSGTAREAASAYPRNANVAATLALAGPGFDATEVTLVADPSAPGNVHEYSVASPLASYAVRIENRPSAGNAKTSVSTVYSVLREIRNRAGPLVI